MAKRPQIWTNEIPRDYDPLKGWRNIELTRALDALGLLGGYPCGPLSTGSLLDTAPAGFGKSALTSSGLLWDTSGMSAPSGNIGGAGGTTGVKPLLSAVASGGLLNSQSGSTSAMNWGIDAGTAYVLSPIDSSIVPSSGAVQQSALLPTPPSAIGYSDLAGANAGLGIGAADQSVVLSQCPWDAIVLSKTDGATGAAAPPSSGGVFTLYGGANLAAPVSGYTAYLIYALPIVSDSTDSDDPNLQAGATEAVIPYYNPANPGTPYAGQNGSGVPQATSRSKICLIGVRAGTNESTPGATVATLSTPAGTIPLYVVIANSTSSALSSCTVFTPGRGTYAAGAPMADSSIAPWLSGHLQQHHLGLPGTAPQIDGSTEWLPLGAVTNNGQNFTGIGSLSAKSYLASGTPSFLLNDVTNWSSGSFIAGYNIADSSFAVTLTAAATTTLNGLTETFSVTFGNPYASKPSIAYTPIKVSSNALLSLSVTPGAATTNFFVSGTITTGDIYEFSILVG